MTDADWLDNDLTFSEWLDAWRAAWRLGAKQPTIVLDYNGVPEYPWQVYLSDESFVVHRGKRVRAGSAPATRRRCTTDEALAFLDAAASVVRIDVKESFVIKLGRERADICNRLGVSVVQELWELYIDHRKKKTP